MERAVNFDAENPSLRFVGLRERKTNAIIARAADMEVHAPAAQFKGTREHHFNRAHININGSRAFSARGGNGAKLSKRKVITQILQTARVALARIKIRRTNR